jgi:hypothetical protein
MADRKKAVSKKKSRGAAAEKTRRRSVETKPEDVDGCDMRLGEADATPDEDLPAARGGVV